MPFLTYTIEENLVEKIELAKLNNIDKFILRIEDLNYNKRPICKTYICALQNACERKFDAIVLKLLEKPDLDRTGITWNNIRYITSLANEQNPLHIVI